MCNFKAALINLKHHLIQELTFYKFKLGHKAVKATKNTCWKGEGAKDHRTVNREFKTIHTLGFVGLAIHLVVRICYVWLLWTQRKSFTATKDAGLIWSIFTALYLHSSLHTALELFWTHILELTDQPCVLGLNCLAPHPGPWTSDALLRSLIPNWPMSFVRFFWSRRF